MSTKSTSKYQCLSLLDAKNQADIREVAPKSDEIAKIRHDNNRVRVRALINQVPYPKWVLWQFNPVARCSWQIPSHEVKKQIGINASVTIDANFSHQNPSGVNPPFTAVKLDFFLHQPKPPIPSTEKDIENLLSDLFKDHVKIKDFNVMFPQLSGTQETSYGEILVPKLEKTLLDLMNLLKHNAALRAEFIGGRGNRDRLVMPSNQSPSSVTEMVAPTSGEIEKRRAQNTLNQIKSGHIRLPPYMEQVQLYWNSNKYSCNHDHIGDIDGHKFTISYKIDLGDDDATVTIYWQATTVLPYPVFSLAAKAINQFFETNIAADDLKMVLIFDTQQNKSTKLSCEKLKAHIFPQFKIITRINDADIIDGNDLMHLVQENASKTAQMQNWPFTPGYIVEVAPTSAEIQHTRLKIKCSKIQQKIIHLPHAMKYLQPPLANVSNLRFFYMHSLDSKLERKLEIRTLTVFLRKNNESDFTIWPRDLHWTIVVEELTELANEMLGETHKADHYKFETNPRLLGHWESNFFFTRLEKQMEPFNDLLWSDEFVKCLISKENILEVSANQTPHWLGRKLKSPNQRNHK
jgi:hypothetical protein